MPRQPATGTIGFEWEQDRESGASVEMLVDYRIEPIIPQTYWEPQEGGECELYNVRVATRFDPQCDQACAERCGQELDCGCELRDRVEELCRMDAYQKAERWDI